MKKIILVLLLLIFKISFAQNGWERVNFAQPVNSFVTDVKIYGNIGLMSTYDPNISYFRISTDGGLNWFISADSIKNTIKISKINNTIWLGSADTVPYRSTNGGLNFTLSGNGMLSPPVNVNFTNITGSSTRIFTAAGMGGIANRAYYSNNNGNSWIMIDTLTQLAGNYPFRQVYADDSIIIIATSTSLLRSFNNGTTWEKYRDSSFSYFGIDDWQDIIKIGNKLYMPFEYSDYRSNIFSSTNNGANWKNEFRGLNQFNFDVHNLRAHNEYIFFYNGFNKMFYGNSNDTVWKNINANVVFDNAFIAGNYVYIFEVQSTNVYRKLIDEVIGIQTLSTSIPDKFYLSQNYPNPFNPATVISFQLPAAGFVKLKVFDLLGREIANLVNENLSAGSYKYDFNASALTSGIYFYKLETDNFSETRKMVLIK